MKELSKYEQDMLKANRELDIPISVFKSTTLNDWERGLDLDYWRYILYNIYSNLLSNSNVRTDWIYIRANITNDPKIPSWILDELEEQITSHEIIFINAINMAKFYLRTHFNHPLSTGIIDEFLRQWINYKIGTSSVMICWDELMAVLPEEEFDGIEIDINGGKVKFKHIDVWETKDV